MNIQDIVLDYFPKFDEKSKLFPVVSLLELDPKEKKTIYKTGPIINQGSEGACVGFAWTNYLLGEPNKPVNKTNVKEANAFAIDLYKSIKKHDFRAGEDYRGTSVLAGAFMAQDLGYIDGYYWCFSVEDVKKAVLGIGPVVVGTKWFKSMYKTREDGLVTVTRNPKHGMHAYVIIGYDPAMKFDDGTHEVFIIKNSWGPSYGVMGQAYIKVSDFRKLAVMAEMCVPVGKTPPAFNEDGTLSSSQPKQNINVPRRIVLDLIGRAVDFIARKLGK